MSASFSKTAFSASGFSQSAFAFDLSSVQPRPSSGGGIQRSRAQPIPLPTKPSREYVAPFSVEIFALSDYSSAQFVQERLERARLSLERIDVPRIELPVYHAEDAIRLSDFTKHWHVSDVSIRNRNAMILLAAIALSEIEEDD